MNANIMSDVIFPLCSIESIVIKKLDYVEALDMFLCATSSTTPPCWRWRWLFKMADTKIEGERERDKCVDVEVDIYVYV